VVYLKYVEPGNVLLYQKVFLPNPHT